MRFEGERDTDAQIPCAFAPASRTAARVWLKIIFPLGRTFYVQTMRQRCTDGSHSA